MKHPSWYHANRPPPAVSAGHGGREVGPIHRELRSISKYRLSRSSGHRHWHRPVARSFRRCSNRDSESSPDRTVSRETSVLLPGASMDPQIQMESGCVRGQHQWDVLGTRSIGLPFIGKPPMPAQRPQSSAVAAGTHSLISGLDLRLDSNSAPPSRRECSEVGSLTENPTRTADHRGAHRRAALASRPIHAASSRPVVRLAALELEDASLSPLVAGSGLPGFS